MRTALKAALMNNELFALYQPQLTADGRKVVSAEALLRWRRPGMGTIGPDDFVPYAESNELIGELGAFMLESACRTAAGWGDLIVAINVSPLQFASGDLARLILDTAASAGLPHERLEIEITETAPFANLLDARSIIAALRGAGVKVSLDDLGSGHSSPALMQRLSLDRVKLGKNVIDLAGSAEGRARVSGLISKARELGLGVTAEGVETQEQLAFLRDCGCDRIQGFFFARPMTGDELTAFARSLEG